MTELVRHRDSCRLCGSHDCELVLPLAPSALADAFVPPERAGEPQPAYALDVYLCRGCGHVQLLDVVDPAVLFADYIYTTASSPGLIDHFGRYADDLGARFAPPPDSLAVDIGSNDGQLLRFLQAKEMRVLGVDPARRIAEEATAAGIPTLNAFFGSAVASDIHAEHGAAAIVTANNVFAHADDLGGIADGIASLLAQDGVFAFEVSYLADLVENMVFDYVYHEHLCYHAVDPLRPFFERHGLELFDVQRVPTKGGSIRGFAQLRGGPRPVTDAVGQLIAAERAAGLGEPETYRRFAAAIGRRREETRRVLAGFKDSGGEIAGYGASATGTTLMYHFGLDDFVSFIVDDNLERQGLLSPGHHIPVVSRETFYERRPAATVILAWRFADPIVGAHGEYLAQGGRFVVPLPEVRVA